MDRVLMVGGAGYIGSHMVRVLRQRGAHVVVLDDLSSGHADAVLDAERVVAKMDDKPVLEQLFKAHRFVAVMHFASLLQCRRCWRAFGCRTNLA